MSGGSYNYLCYQPIARGHLDLGDLKAMRDRLAQIAPDATATRATAQLYEMLSRPVDEPEGDGLVNVWRAVEWCDSGDCLMGRVEEALAEYEAKTVVWLTSADPEPPPGTTVETEGGTRWTRYPDMWPGSWLMDGHEDTCDPETWTKVAGNYGPVRIVRDA